MTNIQKLEALLNLARQAPVPAAVHDQALASARELAQAIEAGEKAIAAAAPVPAAVDGDKVLAGPGHPGGAK